MNDVKQAVEAGVNINIRAMERAVERRAWSEATNSMLVIESLLKSYERTVGAVRIS